MRQEFRDLELLDEITRLHYESKLPNTILGDRRNDLIYSYRLHKGMDYVPPTMHDSIKWSESDPMLEPIDTNIKWNILTQSSIRKKETSNDQNICSQKRNREDDNKSLIPRKKRQMK